VIAVPSLCGVHFVETGDTGGVPSKYVRSWHDVQAANVGVLTTVGPAAARPSFAPA
jgi:hypothetical protein